LINVNSVSPGISNRIVGLILSGSGHDAGATMMDILDLQTELNKKLGPMAYYRVRNANSDATLIEISVHHNDEILTSTAIITGMELIGGVDPEAMLRHRISLSIDELLAAKAAEKP
jgi:hypothetical protein